MIGTINIWIDALAFTILSLAAIGLLIHFFGNVGTGRFRKRFIDKDWTKHAHAEIDHPPVNRILHLFHAVSIIALTITGLSIRFPTILGARDFMRQAHYFFMIVAIVILVGRLYTAFVGELIRRQRPDDPGHVPREADGKEFLMTLADIKNLPNVLLYYMFIRPSYPHISKYNPLQKVTYGISFPPLMILQTYTGLSLIWPQSLLGWTSVFGIDVGLASIYARLAHLVIMWLIVLVTLIHVYMATMEDFPVLRLMFLQKLPDYARPVAQIAAEGKTVVDVVSENVSPPQTDEETRERILMTLERELQLATATKNDEQTAWLNEEITRLKKLPGKVIKTESE